MMVIRNVLVLWVLQLTAARRFPTIPIHKEIVGPGGENTKVDINIEVDIDGFGDPEGSGSNRGPTDEPPVTTETIEPECKKRDSHCEGDKDCCDGLSCAWFHGPWPLPEPESLAGGRHKPLPGRYCELTKLTTPSPPPEPTCLKDGEACPPGPLDCCDGLRCTGNVDHAFCEPYRPTQPPPSSLPPICLKTGEDCFDTPDNCCDGLRCSYKMDDGREASCVEAYKPPPISTLPPTVVPEPTCRKAGEYCAITMDHPTRQDNCCDGLRCVYSFAGRKQICRKPYPPPPITTLPPTVEPEPICLKTGEDCFNSPDDCCNGLRCAYRRIDGGFVVEASCEKPYPPPPITSLPPTVDPQPTCRKAGEDCSIIMDDPTRQGDCCDGLRCMFSPYLRGQICKKPYTPPPTILPPTVEPEPTCLKTGEACTTPDASDKTHAQKCCSNNLCDLDNLKCVRVQWRKTK